MDDTGSAAGFGGPEDRGGDYARDDAPATAFAFEGTWREFAPIAFTNLLLTIVTLGIYRFWATTRERRYLWSRTRFIEDHLEWTGVGKELFFGFLIVLVLFGIPFFVIQVVVQMLMVRGHEIAGVAVFILMLVVIFYLTGLARFRALRYRLGRTHWRGIRGGSHDQGLKYGVSYMWKTAVGYLAMGLMVPWSMASLWNERWNAMSFGQLPFRAEADFSGLMKRYLLFYLSPLLILMLIGTIAFAAAMGIGAAGDFDPEGSTGLAAGAFFVVLILGFYLLWGVAYLLFYAKYLRMMIGATTLGDGIDFGFHASSKDWLKLILGDIGLVIVTLGIGWIFLSYRHWKFFITHLEAYGEIDADALIQSDTQLSRHGEGLLDAFDMGAI